MEKLKLVKYLINFIDESLFNYFVCINIKNILNDKGFIEFFEIEEWKLKKGGKYFVIINDSGIIVFIIGSEKIFKLGYKIVVLYIDSFGFLIKFSFEINRKGFNILNIEVYGGFILSIWFDRFLLFSGRVFVESDNVFKFKKYFIKYDKDLFIILFFCIY